MIYPVITNKRVCKCIYIIFQFVDFFFNIRMFKILHKIMFEVNIYMKLNLSNYRMNYKFDEIFSSFCLFLQFSFSTTLSIKQTYLFSVRLLQCCWQMSSFVQCKFSERHLTNVFRIFDSYLPFPSYNIKYFHLLTVCDYDSKNFMKCI